MNVYAQYVPRTTDAQREFFFQKSETFGLGQTNWAEILWCIWGISGQTVSTILALWVPCPWENVAGSLSHKKLVLGLKHLTPECSQNKISAVKNLGSSVHTSVFGGIYYSEKHAICLSCFTTKEDSKIVLRCLHLYQHLLVPTFVEYHIVIQAKLCHVILRLNDSIISARANAPAPVSAPAPEYPKIFCHEYQNT